MEVLKIILPFIIAALSPVSKAYKQNKNIFQVLNRFDFLAIVLSIFLSMIFLYDHAQQDLKQEESKKTIDSLTIKLNQVNSSLDSIKIQNDSYYMLLTSLGYKLDTTQKNSKRNIDSLMKILTHHQNKVYNTSAYFDICQILFEDEKTEDKLDLRIFVCSDKSVKNIIFKYYTIIPNPFRILNSSSDHQLFLQKQPFYHKDPVISTTIKYPVIPILKEKFFLYVTGSYQDEKNKTYYIKHYFIVNPGEKKISEYMDSNENLLLKLKEFINNNSI